MDMKQLFPLILLFFILFLAVSSVSADDDKSYTIDQAFIDLTVASNGLLHVDEQFDYTFKGTYNGVYRDIPLKSGESIDNIKVSAIGAYPVLKQSEENGQKHLKIFLYADEAHTKKIHDCSVSVFISYDMKNVVTLFNDVGALQYKIWGDEWDVGVGSVITSITLPGNKNNTYFLNPREYTVNKNSNGTTITAETTSIPRGEIYEALILMPLSDFKDATYAKHVNEDGKDKILKNLNDSISSRNFWNTTYLILGLLSILSPIGAIFTYLKYGREPKVDHDGIYERELPSNDSPEIINALIDNKDSIGKPNMKGFQASIMNLIDRGALRMETQENMDSEEKILLIDFNNVDNADLSLSEKSLVNALYPFAENEILNLSSLNDKLSSQRNAKSFQEDYNTWADHVKKESSSKRSEYFDDRGSTLISAIGFLGLAFGVVMAILGFLTELGNGYISILGGGFLIVFSLALMFVPEDIFGRWTKEGRLFYLKWSNFKKFLKDNSLIKEHPPESIVIWKKYLIYGTALGVADNVFKSMKMHVPDISDYDDGIFLYHYYGGYYVFSQAFKTSESAANPSSGSGGFGGFGGGSGGGGGGAF